MKKVISFLLLLALCFALLAGCNSEAPKETEPEKFVTTTFIAEGKSDYVIVYDDSLEGADFARELVTVLSQTYGVAFEATDASEGENACEIIVGNGRDIAKKTVYKLKKPFDFALKVEAIKAAGGEKVLYTELPDHEHDVWNYTYESSEMFAWLMSQRKENG